MWRPEFYGFLLCYDEKKELSSTKLRNNLD